MFCQHPLRILLQQIFLYPPLEDCPLRFHAWDKELPDDPDRIFILDRLRFGFKLIPESDPSCIVAYESDKLNRVAFTLSAVYRKRTQENPAQLLTPVVRMVFL